MDYQAFEQEYLERVEASKSRSISAMYIYVYRDGKDVVVIELQSGFWDWDYRAAICSTKPLVCSPFLFSPFLKEVTD